MVGQRNFDLCSPVQGELEAVLREHGCVRAIMASTISTEAEDWPGLRLRHGDVAARIVERRAMLGNPELPRNAGTNRTESQCALLAAIDAAGGRW